MTNRLVRFAYYGPFPVYGLCVLITLLGAVTAYGATYYVATTGSDSNSGTSSSPWRNPQKCALSPIKAGDTCIVRSGTYTDSNGDGYVVLVYPNTSPAGTASLPITIKSEKPLGAAIVAPSNRNGFGFYVTRPYYIIDGFDISGGNYSGSSGAGIGITFSSTATGGIARSNAIHHIGRSACTNSTNSFSGVILKGASGVLVERNRLYSIGRRRNGESGCSTNKDAHDHGIYVSGGSNTTLRRNVIYDTNRGYPIHVYGGTTSNLKIYHNTLSGRSPTGKPASHILLSSTIRTALIENNISNDAMYGMVYTSGLSASSVRASYNMSNTVTNAMAALKLSAGGVSFSNNFDKVSNLGFVSKSTNDFRLTSGSPPINRGTTLGVPPVNDGAPDISAYEYSMQNTISSPLTPTGVRSL